jgi:antitoxin (DNA-binding transcriptional repressor) of toxin-antitoxin stability system
MTKNLVLKEPVFIEDEGQPVAVLVPIEQFRAWQEQLQEEAFIAETQSVARPSGFQGEKAAFERMRPELMNQYPGKCVAVVGGKVVEVGEEKIEVIEKVRERFGRVPMYVQWLTDKPRVYHVPYRRVVQL